FAEKSARIFRGREQKNHGATIMAESDSLAAQRAGEEGAARVVFERFTRRLIGLAHSQLDERFRHKIDPEDLVQSVYKSFFLRYGDGMLAAEGVDGLWGLLTRITVRKCAERIRYHRAACRDMLREAPAPSQAQTTDPWQEAVAREPTPEEAAV